MKKITLLIGLILSVQTLIAQNISTDPAVQSSTPNFVTLPKGDVVLSWSEKASDGKTDFCMAVSKDKGATFSNKKIITSSYGFGNNRLMKAKVLGKKDGSLVAVFMDNPAAQPGKPSRGGQVYFAVSKDQGNTWSAPEAVDQDPTPGLMRGFFDAVVMANDEIAVVYLKDVKGSTKHEERDLRISMTKNGKFQAEKLLDAVVCDCCNIGMLVDSKGVLNVYYRDNNDDIRDFSHISSKDNGVTFTSGKNIYKDNWQIAGCPHNGAFPVEYKGQNLVAYFTGAETDRGVKLVSEQGKKITTPNEASAKNFGVSSDGQKLVFFWEQTNAQTNQTNLAYQVISGSNVSANKLMTTPSGAANASIYFNGNAAKVAYEVKVDGKTKVEVMSYEL